MANNKKLNIILGALITGLIFFFCLMYSPKRVTLGEVWLSYSANGVTKNFLHPQFIKGKVCKTYALSNHKGSIEESWALEVYYKVASKSTECYDAYIDGKADTYNANTDLITYFRVLPNEELSIDGLVQGFKEIYSAIKTYCRSGELSKAFQLENFKQDYCAYNYIPTVFSRIDHSKRIVTFYSEKGTFDFIIK